MVLDTTFGQPSALNVEVSEATGKRKCAGPFSFTYRAWGNYDQTRSCYVVSSSSSASTTFDAYVRVEAGDGSADGSVCGEGAGVGA